MSTAEKLADKRERRKKLPKRIFAWMVAICVVGGCFAYVTSPYFAFGAVAVKGNKYVSTEDIIDIAELGSHVNILRVSTGELQQRLVKDLRIDTAEVSRQFPATLVITVKERQPLAYVANGYGFIEVDHRAVALMYFRALHKMEVPMITGVSLENVYIGDQVNNPGVSNALKYLSGLDAEALTQISEVNVTLPDNLSAYTIGMVHIKIGSMENIDNKAAMTNDILKEIKDKQRVVEYVDLTSTAPFIKIKH